MNQTKELRFPLQDIDELVQKPQFHLFLKQYHRQNDMVIMPDYYFAKAGMMVRFVTIRGEEPAVTVLLSLLFGALLFILQARQEFLAAPSEPSKLHQLRLRIRQFRSLLVFGKPLLDDAIYRLFQEKMRYYGSALAELREFDVLLADWRQGVQRYCCSDLNLQILSDVLQKNRLERQRQTVQLLQQRSIAQEFQGFWPHLIYRQKQSVDKKTVSIQKFIRQRCRKWLVKQEKLLKETNWHDPNSVHLLRLHGKKLRYILEHFAPLLESAWGKERNKLKVRQEALGKIHDAHQNSALLHRIALEYKLPDLYYAAGMMTGWQKAQAKTITDQMKQQYGKKTQ